MAINAEWHGKHPMPKKPDLQQRIAWHLEHQRQCGCRPIPPALQEQIAAQPPAGKARKPTAPRPSSGKSPRR